MSNILKMSIIIGIGTAYGDDTYSTCHICGGLVFFSKEAALNYMEESFMRRYNELIEQIKNYEE